MLAANRKQAMVPRGAQALDPVGTAPGLVVPVDGGPTVIVLPGPPRELQAMWPAALATPAAKRLTLLQLPAYAPTLNPQEGIWRYLKYVELANVCCHDLAELRLELRRAIQRVRYRLDVNVGCLRHVNCSVSHSITG